MSVLTLELLEALEHATLRKGRDALLRAAALPDNPYGVFLLEERGLLAYCVRSVPNLPWYNTIIGIGETSLGSLSKALAMYLQAEIKPTVVTWATRLTPQVGAALFDHGFTPCGVGTTLYMEARGRHLEPASRVSVRKLRTDEAVSEFNAVLLGGYGFINPVQRALAVLENASPTVQRYLATVDGQAAAVAALTEHDGIAHLAGAATLEAWRGRGAQTALIAARLADAARSSRWVTVTTAFASQSQANLERMGFRIAHVKTFWGQRSQIHG